MNEKQKSKKSDVMLKFFLNPEIGIMIPILLVCVITTILKPNFLIIRARKMRILKEGLMKNETRRFLL